MPGSPSTALIAPGFADPVHGAQAVFRTVMNALAQPASIHLLPATLVPPRPLTPELAAIALALADHEAPLFLDAALAAAPDVAAYLRFHTGAAIVTDPAAAAFALISDAAALPPLEIFAEGTDADPDQSTTVVVAVESLNDSGGLTFAGPGIAGTARLDAAPLPPDFPARLKANRRTFPRGIDLILAAPGRIAGLPRSCVLQEG